MTLPVAAAHGRRARARQRGRRGHARTGTRAGGGARRDGGAAAGEELVQADLAARGRGEDDAVFRMHVVDGLTYAQVAARTGRTEAECLNTARRVAAALRAAVRDLLREEGVLPSELDAAVDEVLAIMERGGE